MNEDSIKLIKEVSSGAKMAINSFHQLQEYIKDDDLFEVVNESLKKHEDIEEAAKKILMDAGEEEKEPGLMASAMSWTTTELKLLLKADNKQISEIIMDGCNMGIKGISEKMNGFADASSESRHLANRLVEDEEKLIKKLREYL